MNKVGLLTCYADNFGACLQAYALQRSINKCGCDCEIIKYSPIRSQKIESINIFLKWMLRLRNTIKALTSREYKYENSRKKMFDEFRNKYLVFSKKNYLNLKRLEKANLIYCSFVAGSDQIWNPNLYNMSLDKAYFLSFVTNGKKKIAYAPSIGVDSIPISCEKDLKKFIETFDFLSVREESGQRILNRITSKKCEVVLDPTLLLNKQDWVSICKEPIINKPYILCYLFGNKDFYSTFVEFVRKELLIDVVVIPVSQRDYYSDYYKIGKMGPLEFVNLIKNATLVITDSFHATAFSINLNVPFYSLLRNDVKDKNNMNSRVTNLLSIVSLENRLVYKEKFNSNFVVNLNINFEKSDALLNKKREHDFNLLKGALNDNKV